MGDFDFKSTISGDNIINAYQRKAEAEQQARMQEEQLKLQKTRQWMDVAAMAGDAVSKAIQVTRENQKRSFVNTLADSMALKASLTPNKDGQTASFDPDKQDIVGSAVRINPDPFISQLAKSAIPVAQTGTPARSFESYLIGQVNAGLMTPEEAAEQLGQLKPSNVVIGYTEDGIPIYSNTKSVKPGAQPLPTAKVDGGVFEKPARVSETELGKQADAEGVRLAVKEIEDNYDDSFVGPVAGRLNTLKQTFDKTATDKRGKFITGLSSYRNAAIKAITGAQMSEPEAKRIMKQLPNEKMSKTDFKAKLRISSKLLEQGLEKRRKQLQKGGFTGVPSTKKATELPIGSTDLGGGFSYSVEP